MNKNALYLGIFGVLCALAGVLVGININKPPRGYFNRPYFRQRQEFMPSRFQARKDGRFLEMLSAKLELSPEQKTKVKEILENTRKKMEDLGKNLRQQIAEVKDSADKEIWEILNPQQQEKFKALKDEFKKRATSFRQEKLY